jgi:hypothetical protein
MPPRSKPQQAGALRRLSALLGAQASWIFPAVGIALFVRSRVLRRGRGGGGERDAAAAGDGKHHSRGRRGVRQGDGAGDRSESLSPDAERARAFEDAIHPPEELLELFQEDEVEALQGAAGLSQEQLISMLQQ